MKVLLCFITTIIAVQALPGLFSIKNNNRIVGGDEASPHQFPYQVGLNLFFEDGSVSFCGGSLISNRYVLTAAHCTQQVSKIEVVMGAHEVNNEKEPSQIRMNSSVIIVHEQWNSILLQNDIALVKLPRPVVQNKYINQVKLPSKLSKNDFARYSGTVSGWGKISDGSNHMSPVLRYVDTDILSLSDCQTKYPMVIKETHLCTSGRDGKSSCNGDSGGPLVVHENGANVQVGIVSFGRAYECQKGYPAVFTRVTKYLDWIEKNSDAVIAFKS